MNIIGQEELIKMLVDHGADINVRDKFNNTPLISAIASGTILYKFNFLLLNHDKFNILPNKH